MLAVVNKFYGSIGNLYSAPLALSALLRPSSAFHSAVTHLANGSAADEGESTSVDVLIVGAGPAGLSAAIRLKQLSAEHGRDLSVCVIEKGAEVGAHILSGNVFQPTALDELLPDWRNDPSCPVSDCPVTRDRFYFLTRSLALRLPTPPQMHNKGNYVISLSEVVRWLASRAESLGVDIYAGFSGAGLLRGSDGAITGVRTNDVGVGRDGRRRDNYAPGMSLSARVTLLAEGCRGSLSQEVIAKYGLREKAGADPQTYALGVKEVWEVDPAKHSPGTVWHTVGWPLPVNTYGGGWLYHMKGGRVSLGLVVAMDYSNPRLSPYQEFQQFKRHPKVAKLLEGGTCVQYGARTLVEGGTQSLPSLAFPGGALVGDAAGFLNVPKIKGTHTAMKSGILAAEHAFQALTSSAPVALSAYEQAVKDSWVYKELHAARNIRPGFSHFGGLYGGLVHAALDTYLFRGRAPWTLRHSRADHEALKPLAQTPSREYPRPDGKLTFDIPTSLHRSGTNHNHDQPAHLQLRNPKIPYAVNLPLYGGPEARYCPAGVYEYVPDEASGLLKLQINAQNCLHCKACDVKDPLQNIHWTVPEGGGGPSYTMM